MGAGIATALLLSGSEVRLLERDTSAAEIAHARVDEMLDASVARGAVSREAADQAIDRFAASADETTLISCDLIIEAVFEDMGASAISSLTRS
ncbi:hypothetical protein EHI46_15535 [Rhizobium leguminosarum]|uniref:3-hydroxyacyl-CoA dehydrogenase NAD-binding domain-containing protein n=1 Tax=Rhizobium leguminosarum TaxID=384 RepID=UPI000FF4B214|nr:hypothetical protein EHI46_15535 [Rhizobium leguminosarum]